MAFSALASRRTSQQRTNQYALAVVALKSGRFAESLVAFDDLLQSDPAHSDALSDSAVALASLGRVDEAVERFSQAAAAAPENAVAHHNLGLLLRQLGRFDEATAAFARSLSLDACNPAWWVDAGNAHLDAMRPSSALEAYEQALRVDAQCIGALTNRAVALRALSRPADAERACREAIAASPRHVDAWNNLGMVLKEFDRVEEAETALATAIALDPSCIAAAANLCALYLQTGRRSEASTLAHDLVRRHPESAEAWNALGHAQLESGLLDDALASCARALAIAPANQTATFNQAFVLLLLGNFSAGFASYEARRRVTNQVVATSRATGREWDGSALHGETILLTTEQGAGDMIQFVRYGAVLTAHGAGRVILEVPPALSGVLAAVAGISQTVRTDAPLPAYDLHVPLLSLPRLFGTRLDSIPNTVPYLRAPDRAVGVIVRRAPGLRVGFAWSGNPRQHRNRIRSVPFTHLFSAMDQPGVSLFSLQVGGAVEPALMAAVRAGRVTDLAPDLHTFEDTAAAIAECDLVVSVCTSIAHLAGALGRPTWTLLAHIADWRWLRARDDSPWYPTMRLFRQDSFDDWGIPLANLSRALTQLATSDPAERAVAGTSGACRPASIATQIPLDSASAFQRASRLHASGRSDEALAAYDAILSADPQHADALNNSAVLHAQRGEAEEAERRMRAAIASLPHDGQAHSNLGLLLRGRGDLVGALAEFGEAIACEPHRASWWRDHANCASSQLRHDMALTSFTRAVALAPADVSVVTDHAAALLAASHFDEAVSAGRDAVRLDATRPQAHATIGLALTELRRWGEAEAALQAGLTAIPGSPLLLSRLATLYLRWGRLGDSRHAAQQLVAAQPLLPDGHNSLGCIYVELGELDAARKAFVRARTLDPANKNANVNLSMLDLLGGDFDVGLPGFEERLTSGQSGQSPSRLPGTAWDCDALNGKHVVILEEQGLGDVLQFVRYAKELKMRGASRVTVQCSSDAAELIRTVPGVDGVTLRGMPLPQHDVIVPIMSLPHRCGTTIGSIPSVHTYMTASDRPVAQIVQQAQGLLKVGLVWGGNPEHQRDRYRSVPLPTLLSAIHSPGIALFSLQKGPYAGALGPWIQAGIVSPELPLGTLSDTASATMALDLVVTVDTAVAHLAGALGQRVWTLLSAVPDWRWFLGRDDTPWYPTMRLFRQTLPGDWSHPVVQIRAALQELLEQRTAAGR